MPNKTFNEWLNVKYGFEYDNFSVTYNLAKDLIYLLNNNNIFLSIDEEEFIKKFQYFLYKRSVIEPNKKINCF